MSEASDFNMQDPNAAENIPAGLAAEIERGLAEANLSSSESADSDGRILDAICEAGIAETPRAAAELAAQNSSEPLARLLLHRRRYSPQAKRPRRCPCILRQTAVAAAAR